MATIVMLLPSNHTTKKIPTEVWIQKPKIIVMDEREAHGSNKGWKMLVRQTTRLLDDKDAPEIFLIMFALNVEIQTFLLFLKFFSNEENKRIKKKL